MEASKFSYCHTILIGRSSDEENFPSAIIIGLWINSSSLVDDVDGLMQTKTGFQRFSMLSNRSIGIILGFETN